MDVRAWIEALYGLTAAGKWDEVSDYLTDDFYIDEAPSLPYGGKWEGRDALQRLYTHVFRYWDEPELIRHDLTLSDDHAVALITINATSRATGERLAMRLTEVFHFRDGKICAITPYYFDTAAIVKATTPAG